MTIHELKEKFLKKKSYPPHDFNQLLDFARNLYLLNELPLRDYRDVVRDLETAGAISPTSLEKTLLENTTSAL
ncbi:MAG: hypothetical protein IMW92_06105 [Bacillales bacterium]|nr:hypothetical protein [Bacillales bacterium]